MSVEVSKEESKGSSDEMSMDMENHLHRSYEIHSDVLHGFIQDLKIVPKIHVYGFLCKGSGKNTHRVKNLKERHSYNPKHKDAKASFGMDDKKKRGVPTLQWGYHRNCPKITSFEELYTVGAKSDKVLIEYEREYTPATHQEVEHSKTPYHLCSISYDIVGTLESDSPFNEHQEVVLDNVDSFEDISESYVQELRQEYNSKIPVKYESTESKYNDISFRETDNKKRSLLNSIQTTKIKIASSVSYIIILAIMTLMGRLPELYSSGSHWVFELFNFLLFCLYSIIGMYAISTKIAPIFEKPELHKASFISPNSCKMNIDDSIKLYDDYSYTKNLRKTTRDMIDSLPREITIEISEDMKIAKAKDRDIVWSLGDENVMSEEAVDFFIDYGFDKDNRREIETHMVKNREDIPNHMEYLTSSCGDWYLLSNKKNYTRLIDLNTVQKEMDYSHLSE